MRRSATLYLLSLQASGGRGDGGPETTCDGVVPPSLKLGQRLSTLFTSFGCRQGLRWPACFGYIPPTRGRGHVFGWEASEACHDLVQRPTSGRDRSPWSAAASDPAHSLTCFLKAARRSAASASGPGTLLLSGVLRSEARPGDESGQLDPGPKRQALKPTKSRPSCAL